MRHFVRINGEKYEVTSACVQRNYNEGLASTLDLTLCLWGVLPDFLAAPQKGAVYRVQFKRVIGDFDLCGYRHTEGAPVAFLSFSCLTH